MTATGTTDGTLAARGRERHATTSAARTALAGNAIAALWYWPIVVIVSLVVGIVEARVDAIDGSVFLGVALAVSSFLFVMGIILSSSYLAVHVAAGGTRRAYAAGHAVAACITAAGSGVLMALGLFVERLIFEARGWPLANGDLTQLYGGTDYPLAVLVTALSCAAYYLTGASVAMAYYRWGGWRGTAVLPLLLLPPVLTEVSLRSGYYGNPLAQGLNLAPTNVPLATLGALAAIVLTFAALRLITRTIPIRPVT